MNVVGCLRGWWHASSRDWEPATEPAYQSARHHANMRAPAYYCRILRAWGERNIHKCRTVMPSHVRQQTRDHRHCAQASDRQCARRWTLRPGNQRVGATPASVQSVETTPRTTQWRTGDGGGVVAIRSECYHAPRQIVCTTIGCLLSRSENTLSR